jgi:hypothetical protein
MRIEVFKVGHGSTLHSVSTDSVAPLLFKCAKTVSEPYLLHPRELRFQRKQIPRFVGIVNS